ncbi:TlpA disulfide reductase family protein [Sphingobacterium sp. BIGb0165]|uniref:TlpA family protein disulfide reductase n=1 Tax=Sphingobacterium sp. BIGb0165 TaxID=2940615 RepID=UPI002168DDA0|nr:TlpA disulfide reductase family protein [Sphingobacterium sp. BIGb0165]MCS4226429.1 thiol-disulfide isomerase/thioredoxin [Sphingobacterium sp. BIGb0165]
MNKLRIYTAIVTGVILFLLIAFQANGQIKALKVGDRLPAAMEHRLLNYKSAKVNLDELQDKVVILDFFDTFCSNCIEAMPKLQKLQNELGDKLQIIVVTWQDSATITKFFRTNQYLKEKNIKLPIIVSDTTLKKLFIHQGLPHVAWLFKNRVAAITFSEFSKAEHVERLYQDGKIQLPLKNDFENNEPEAPVVGDSAHSDRGGSVLTGYRDGATEHGFLIYRDTMGYGTYGTLKNMPILAAYVSMWTKVKKPKFLLNKERIVWEVADSNKYNYLSDKLSYREWLLDYGICYERKIMRNVDDLEFAKSALEDMNQLLGLAVYWDERINDCLELKKLPANKINRKTVMQKTGGGDTMMIEGTDVLTFAVDMTKKYPPCIDLAKTDIKMEIGEFKTMEELNLQLAKYGLVISKGRRAIEVLVIKEK